MSTFLRKLRGAVGLAALWGLGWYLIAAVVWSVLLFGDVSFGIILNLAAGVAIGGSVVGGTFAGLLGIAERNKTFAELSYARLAGLGALGGALVALPFLGELYSSMQLSFVTLLAGMGAGSAVGTLSLARHADRGGSLGSVTEPPSLGPGVE